MSEPVVTTEFRNFTTINGRPSHSLQYFIFNVVIILSVPASQVQHFLNVAGFGAGSRLRGPHLPGEAIVLYDRELRRNGLFLSVLSQLCLTFFIESGNMDK